MNRRIILSTIIATIALIAATSATPATQNPIRLSNMSQTKAAVTITLATNPTPAVSGENDFVVTVKNADGTPVENAEVSVQLLMPAMPAMSMPEMKSAVSLGAAEGAEAKPGNYTGRGQIPMPGRWNVTVAVSVDGKILAEKKLTLFAK